MKRAQTIRSHEYVILDPGGTVRFRMTAAADKGSAADFLGSQLAIFCLSRRAAPADFEIACIADVQFATAVRDRARALLESGRSLGAGVKLSNREKQVLDGVLERLSNKTIGDRLHISERTVKYHVSNLLGKYGVSDRVELCSKVNWVPEFNVPEPARLSVEAHP